MESKPSDSNESVEQKTLSKNNGEDMRGDSNESAVCEMSREKRICLMASSLMAASHDLPIDRALLVAERIVDFVLRLKSLGLPTRRMLVGRLS
jgi:hypothetical protein